MQRGHRNATLRLQAQKLLANVDDQTATHLACDDLWGPHDRVGETDSCANHFQLRRVQIAGEPGPRLTAQGLVCVDALNSSQRDAAQDERSHAPREIDSLRQTTGRYYGVVLALRACVGERVTADRIDDAPPALTL